jgi:L-fuconolactonase
MLVVDAHQHFWNPELISYPWLKGRYEPVNGVLEFDDVVADLRRNGIDRTVLVQSGDHQADTDYMFGVAHAHPEIAAVVAWVPLDRPDEVGAGLERLSHEPSFVGIRNLIHDQPDPDWLLRDEVDRSLGLLERAELPFDVIAVLPRHLDHVATVAARHPGLRLVVDHLGAPPIKAGDDWEPWKALMAAAAAHPNVYAKVSGLYPVVGDLSDWTTADIEPFVHYVLELFGADRLMYGSDWPVVRLGGGYGRVWAALNEIFGRLSDAERRALLGGTAVAFYRISDDRLPGGER